MIERSMRKRLVKLLRPLGAFAVENGGAHPGTPDIAYVGGWIECKATNQWPARETTRVTLDHRLTPQQKIWILQWQRAGGTSWVMLHIDREWMLFAGPIAARHVGTSTRSELYDLSTARWTSIPTTDDLLSAMGEV